MGLNLGKIASTVVPTVIGFYTGGPAGAAAGFTSAASAQKQAREVEKQNIQIAQRNEKMAEIFGSSTGLRSVQAPMAGQSTQNAGFGAGFGSFLTDVGRNIVSPFAGLATQLAPFFGKSVQQQPAVTTTRGVGAQETQQSGAIQGFIGAPGLGQAISAAGRFLRTPTGQIGTGLGIGGLTALIGDDGKPMRITRKMKAQYRSVLNLAGGNYQLAADMIGVSDDMFIQVMLKRFRNDGAVVTKAALRKTKQTVRRLKNMCDMYDSLRPAATRRRAAPMKRAATTLISNK
jgi:gas vesicle protein